MPPDRFVRVALVLLLAVGCSGGTAGSAPATSSPAANATTAPLLPTEVAALPDVTPAGYDTLIAQLRGTPVVVNLWGSWCSPCREEAPALAQAARTYGDQVQFVGIDVLDTKPAAARYIREFSLPYPSLFDPSSNADIRNHLGYIGQPDTVFYDAQGVKSGDWEGAISSGELDRRIQALLPSSTPG